MVIEQLKYPSHAPYQISYTRDFKTVQHIVFADYERYLGAKQYLEDHKMAITCRTCHKPVLIPKDKVLNETVSMDGWGFNREN